MELKNIEDVEQGYKQELILLRTNRLFLPFYSFKKRRDIDKKIKSKTDMLCALWKSKSYPGFSDLPVELKLLVLGLNYLMRKL